MFGGYETIEAYEDDLYREESSSELSVDSEVEFQLYSQVHYAQDLDNVIKEEEHEEKNSGNSESFSSKPNQKNLIILSDSEVIQLSDGSEVITLSDEDSIYKCKRKNFRVPAEEKTQGPPAFLHSNELADKKCKRDIEKTKPGERSGTIQEVMIIEVSSSEEEESTISESDNVESWMLLGCEVDDKDDDILLNLVGCEKSVNEGEYSIQLTLALCSYLAILCWFCLFLSDLLTQERFASKLQMQWLNNTLCGVTALLFPFFIVYRIKKVKQKKKPNKPQNKTDDLVVKVEAEAKSKGKN
ncbi:hypothetical protein E2I00_003517 [Balaenoptera physalus]|uniref:Uncharacterized protein n=1 Tax=Balaenoptera physalus TaxID=9770 RepID=A0A6A1QH14_BALPH|nr:hypothetical protein E2I00_003517 [Balaenoptera physalus]